MECLSTREAQILAFVFQRVACTVPCQLDLQRLEIHWLVCVLLWAISTCSPEECAIGRGVAAVRHKTGSRSHSYHFMWSIRSVLARFEAEGTVFGSIGKKDFHAITCVKPSRDLVLAYEACVSSLDNRIEVNERKSRTLAALRDTLLPKLISGALRVKDAERFLEERGVC